MHLEAHRKRVDELTKPLVNRLAHEVAPERTVVTEASQVARGDRLAVRVRDGELETVVADILRAEGDEER